MDNYKKIYVPEQVDDVKRCEIQLEFAKKEIAKFDYIGVKIATGVSTIEDYQEEITYMESIRQVINELEEELLNNIEA